MVGLFSVLIMAPIAHYTLKNTRWYQITVLHDDPEIGVLVLGAGTDNKGPGPLVTLLSRQAGSLPIPITIVPGDLSKERLEAIT